MSNPNQLSVLRNNLALLPESDVVTTEEQGEVLANYFNAQRYGAVTSTFAVCEVNDCQFSKRCPYIKAGVDMEQIRDELCPVEQNLVKMWMEQFANEMDLHPTDTITLSQVRDLTMDMMVEMRVRQTMADEDIVVDVFRFLTPAGDIVNEAKPNGLFATLKDILKSKEAKLKSLMATPFERAKNKTSQVRTMIESLAMMKDQMRERSAGEGATVVELLTESPVEDWDKVDQLKAGMIQQETMEIEENQNPKDVPEVPQSAIPEPPSFSGGNVDREMP